MRSGSVGRHKNQAARALRAMPSWREIAPYSKCTTSCTKSRPETVEYWIDQQFSAAGHASVASDQALAFEHDRHLIDRKRSDPKVAQQVSAGDRPRTVDLGNRHLGGVTQQRHSSIKWMFNTAKARKKVAHAC